MEYTLDSKFQGFSGIYPTQVKHEFMVQFWDKFPLTVFTGSSANSPIIQRKNVNSADKSFSVRVPKIYGGDYKNVRKNWEKRVAYAQTLDSSYDEITYDYYSHVIKYSNIWWLSQGQPLLADIPAQAMDDLSRMTSLHTQQMFFDSVCTMYPTAVAGKMPRKQRAVAGTGTWDYNNGRTLAQQVEVVIPNAQRANHRMSMKHIRKISSCVHNKTSGEDQLRPAEIKLVNGFPDYGYHLFISRNSYEYLAIDDEYQKTMTQRGTILPYQPNSVEGADYKGKVEGIHLWVVDFLSNYEFDASGATAWSFLLGGAGFMIGLNEMDRVTKDIVNGDDEVVLTSHITKAIKCLTFPCQAAIKDPDFDFAANINSRIESGVVHSFTRLAA